MKRLVWLLWVLVGGPAWAQNPDLVIKVDARLQFLSQSTGPTFVRFYDNLGHHSVASVRAFLEPGFQAFVSQKFAKIPHDGDRDQFDEYYVEDEGLWRVGKQYLPFGSGKLLRESVLAVRGDTQLIVEDIPIAISACDSGRDRQQGVVGRIGSTIGLSFAIGNHFGINGTSYDLIRRPEDAPGVGRGYRQIFGLDISRRFSGFLIGGEINVLRAGNTPLDVNNTVFDLSSEWSPNKYQTFTAGWSRDVAQGFDFYRLMGSIYFSRNLIIEPIVRYRGGALFDAAVTLHFKF